MLARELERDPTEPPARSRHLAIQGRAFVPFSVHSTSVRECLSAIGARAKCATSRCRRCTPKLPRLPRSSILRGRAKSRRCETLPEPFAARLAPRLEFLARRAARRACRRYPESRSAADLLRAPHQSKHFSADGA